MSQQRPTPARQPSWWHPPRDDGAQDAGQQAPVSDSGPIPSQPGSAGSSTVSGPAATSRPDRTPPSPVLPNLLAFTMPTRRGNSWPRVAANTLSLKLRRRGRVELDSSFWLVATVGALFVVGVTALVLLALGLVDGSRTGADESPVRAPASVPSAGSSGSDTLDSNRVAPRATPSVGAEDQVSAGPSSSSKAAAGTEIAARTDVLISPAVHDVLRTGRLDGRVLIALAALASEHRLVSVTLPPDADPLGTGDPVAVEIGVADVDATLDWLDAQPQLKPAQLVVRREGTVAHLQLTYDTPEPPDLFTS